MIVSRFRGSFLTLLGTDLLHDAGFSLGESDVPTRLVLNELDLNLSSLATALVIIIVVIVSGRRNSGTLGASRLDAVAGEVVAWGRLIKTGGRIGDISHCEREMVLFGKYRQD